MRKWKRSNGVGRQGSGLIDEILPRGVTLLLTEDVMPHLGSAMKKEKARIVRAKNVKCCMQDGLSARMESACLSRDSDIGHSVLLDVNHCIFPFSSQ